LIQYDWVYEEYSASKFWRIMGSHGLHRKRLSTRVGIRTYQISKLLLQFWVR